jgi:hypothetical protein
MVVMVFLLASQVLQFQEQAVVAELQLTLLGVMAEAVEAVVERLRAQTLPLLESQILVEAAAAALLGTPIEARLADQVLLFLDTHQPA